MTHAQPESHRSQKVAGLIQRELATLLQRQLPMTEFGLITISGVSVSADLRHAKVYVTCLNTSLAAPEIEARLNAQAGHFRSHLAKLVTLRYLPALRFLYDESVAYGSQMSALINQLDKGDNPTE